MKFPLSFSRLNTFESCPRKFEHLYVNRTVKDTDNEFTLYGSRVHTALETYGKAKDQGTAVAQDVLSDGATYNEVRAYLPLVDTLLAQKGTKYFEEQMAIDANKQRCDWFSPDVWLRGIADVLIIDGHKAFVGDWKGLPLGTELPTPTGFTTMGSVRVGDTLFSESGEQCQVVGKSQVKNLRCYEITFDDTSRVSCDEEHLWKLHDGTVVPVTALRKNDLILTAAPLALPDVDLPIDPYVLGLWVADGKHTSAEISKPDSFVWEEIQRRGYTISHDYSKKSGDGKCRVHTVKGLRTQLRQAGLLGNKRIPEQYLRAGYQQRLDLLRGLMDGDGSANPHRKQAVYTTVDKALSDKVVELLCSLGQRPLQSVVAAHGFGKDVIAYPISFRPVGINPFLLPRKADRILASWGAGYAWRRRVVSVEEIPSVPTQCIAVDSSDHTFLCTRRMIPTHNTGKVKDSPLQLKMFAAMVFALYPEVTHVRTAFIWLATGEITDHRFTRDMLDDIWATLDPRLAAVQDAVDVGVFKSRPTPLCNWCAAKGICPDRKKR